MPAAAVSRSARAVTIAGFLPPISTISGRSGRVSCRVRAISWPASAEPVKATPSMSAPTSARPVASSPWTRLRTPGGSPASTASSAISPVDHGVSSAGFITTVLPVTSAPLLMPTASANGKLNGQITAKTP